MMPTPEPPFVTIEEVGQVLHLSNRQIRNDIRKGYLPGVIDHRGDVRIRRKAWNDFLENGMPEPATAETADKVSFIRKVG